MSHFCWDNLGSEFIPRGENYVLLVWTFLIYKNLRHKCCISLDSLSVLKFPFVLKVYATHLCIFPCICQMD